jgi:hypothetical protein
VRRRRVDLFRYRRMQLNDCKEPAERQFARGGDGNHAKSRETDAGLVSLVDVNGINEAYAADRSGHH